MHLYVTDTRHLLEEKTILLIHLHWQWPTYFQDLEVASKCLSIEQLHLILERKFVALHLLGF